MTAIPPPQMPLNVPLLPPPGQTAQAQQSAINPGFAPQSRPIRKRAPTPPQGKLYLVKPPATTTETDRELAGRVRALYHEARHYRAPMVAKWKRWYRIIRNRTWLNPLPWYPNIEVPEIWPIIESLVGWMTDSRPTFDVMPFVSISSDYANFMTQLGDDLRVALQANWYNNENEATEELIVRDGFIYGVGISKTIWDTSLVDGLGDGIIRRVDPWTFYPDPNATCLEDSNYFIEAYNTPLQTLDRRFPGAAAKLSASGYKEEIDVRPTHDSFSEAPKANPGAISGVASRGYGLPGQSRRSVAEDKQGVTVLEAWIREHRTTGTVGSVDDPLTVHDDWRCVVVAGPEVLLNERASDLWEVASHPYDRFVPAEEGEFYGRSMVEMLAPCQLAINRLLAAAQHNLELTGNPVLLEPTMGGTSRVKVTNQPGQRLPYQYPNSKPEWLMPPPLRSDITVFIQFYIGEMERISGLSAITRGMSPGGRQAADVMQSMQEASFVRVRMASRQLERTMRGQGSKLASMITEFYTDPRMVALLGPNGDRTTKIFKAKHFYVPNANPSESSPQRTLPFRFQLLIDAGSSLPTSRQARAAEADALFAMGALDQQGVLEAHQWPNRALIIQRLQAQAQAAATNGQPPSRASTGRQQ